MTIRKLIWRRAALLLLLVAAAVWYYSRPLIDLFDRDTSPQARFAGHALFVHEWQPHDALAHGDGLGPVYNAKSCVACHFQGGIGGSGDNVHNVTAYEVHPNLRERYLQKGLVHAYSVDEAFGETEDLLKQCYPIIKGGDRVVGGCTVRFEDFDPVHVARTNSISLFGDGLIDRISATTIRLNHTQRLWQQIGQEIRGNFHEIEPGRPHVLSDGRIGKFGWKAQFSTLKEFVAAACANELGLGNPLMEQAKPLGSDERCQQMDLNRKELRQLVAFVDGLSRPVQMLPDDRMARATALRGKSLFNSIGCAVCHTPDMGEVAGIYSDLLLHSLTTHPSDGYRHEIQVEVPLSATHPQPDEWRTPPLWGVADSAPYFHDGGAETLEAAILRHEGGALGVKKEFLNLTADEQQAIVRFLETLKAPADAQPAQPLPTAGVVAAN